MLNEHACCLLLVQFKVRFQSCPFVYSRLALQRSTLLFHHTSHIMPLHLTFVYYNDQIPMTLAYEFR